MTTAESLAGSAEAAAPPTRVVEDRGIRASPEPAPAGQPIRVAYVMSRFPKLSETFVANEILAVERAGVATELHPLIREHAGAVQPATAALVRRAHYLPLLSPRVLAAQLFFLGRRPAAWLGALGAILAGTWRSPRTLVRSLALYPAIVGHARLILDEGVDHVHCHFATYPALAGFVVHRLTGIPYSFTAHAHDIQVDQSMLGRKVAEAAFVVAISEESRKTVLAACDPHDDARVRVIHCGVDTAEFQPPSAAAPPDRRPFTIVSVGRLIPVKGHLRLVDACARLAAAGVPFRCHIVGDGPLRDLIQERIAARGLTGSVELLGARTSDEVRDLLRDADALVLPSVPTADGRREGIPIVLMEAMSSGLAVVASRMAGIPELVEDRVGGLLVEPGDTAALADALMELARDRDLRERLGRAGRTRVLAEFDLDTQARRLASEFEDVVDVRRAAHREESAAAVGAA
jgi:glycosyltransferase involved in cell wall biosynthesis